MKAITFKGANVEYVGENNNTKPLPAFLDPDGIMVTCWELSAEELKQVLDTGKVYICMHTNNNPIQPLKVSVFKSDFMINVIDN